MKSAKPRKRHSDHFAFMRAVVQGQDLHSNWDRYLRIEASDIGERRMRWAIAWIRMEFAAAARRAGKHGTARLMLIDAQQLGAEKAPPLRDEFSDTKLVKEYDRAFSAAARSSARLVERQLEALRWLEGVAAETPKASDSVHDWLRPSLASRLRMPGIPTLRALVERINETGAGWWVHVMGVGEGKAGRIVEWLRLNEASIDMYIGGHTAPGESGERRTRASDGRRAAAPMALALEAGQQRRLHAQGPIAPGSDPTISPASPRPAN